VLRTKNLKASHNLSYGTRCLHDALLAWYTVALVVWKVMLSNVDYISDIWGNSVLAARPQCPKTAASCSIIINHVDSDEPDVGSSILVAVVGLVASSERSFESTVLALVLVPVMCHFVSKLHPAETYSMSDLSTLAIEP